MKNIFKIVIFLSLFSSFAKAQDGQTLEEIVAVVGDYIITKSELETEYLQSFQETEFFPGDLKCEILSQLIVQKLFLHKGEVDSIDISEDFIESEVDRRIKYYSYQIGGEKNFEKYLGKSVAEYKNIIRPKVKEQLMTQQVREKLMADIKVTPTEVRQFFYNIPQDSIPVVPTEVELSQVVLKPKANFFAKDYAKEKLAKIREEIIAGNYSFEFAARSNSEDPGSAVNGGELGYFGRGMMVREFEKLAFRLPPDSISEIFESDYGYHILKVIDRKGETVNARHILIKPLIVESDKRAAKLLADSLINELKKGTTTLCEVAKNYSSDQNTSEFCGYFVNPNNQLQQIPLDALDPEAKSQVAVLKPKEYSTSFRSQMMDGTTVYKFYYLNSLIPEHTANLKDDYQKIHDAAKSDKEQKEIINWANKYKESVYVWIDEKYRNCQELELWKGLD